MSSETDSGHEVCDGDTRSGENLYPQLNDIDFDMDTTEYEVYKDYIDDAEDDREDKDDRDVDGDDHAGRGESLSVESVSSSSGRGSGGVQSSVKSHNAHDEMEGKTHVNGNDSDGQGEDRDDETDRENNTDKDGRERDKVRDRDKEEKEMDRPHREPVSFPSRLFDVLSEESPSIIQWKDKGTAFHITDVTAFVRDILFNRFKCTYVK
jgi:hypothetical protein